MCTYYLPSSYSCKYNKHPFVEIYLQPRGISDKENDNEMTLEVSSMKPCDDESMLPISEDTNTTRNILDMESLARINHTNLD